MFSNKTKFSLTLILRDTGDTYKELITYDSTQAFNINIGDYVNTHGFTIDYGLQDFVVENIQHFLYERDNNVISKTNVFIRKVDKEENPIKRWTYQYETQYKNNKVD